MADRSAASPAKTLIGLFIAFAASIGACWAFDGRLAPWLAALLMSFCCLTGAAAGARMSRRPELTESEREWEEFERRFRDYALAQESRQRL